MKMILLIKPEPAHNPFSLDAGLRTEPLELEYIAAMLEEEGWTAESMKPFWKRPPSGDI